MRDTKIYNEDNPNFLSVTLFPDIGKYGEENKKNLDLIRRKRCIIHNYGLQNEVWTNEYIGIESFTEEGKSPFEELYDKQSPENKIRRIIEEVRRLKLLTYTDRITNRLQYLLETTLDDTEENTINPDSLLAFLAFMKLRKELKYPDITLSPAGNITARWRKDINRNLCIEFLSLHEAQFVVFAPDPIRTLRITGIIPINALWNALKPYQVTRWAVDK